MRPSSPLPPCDLAYFENDYPTARAAFRRSLDQLEGAEGMERSVFSVPSKLDPDLTVDDVYLPAQVENETLYVFISGIHGMEGATGSALQRLFLKEFWPELTRAGARAHSGFWLVHAMNPFGFRFDRRPTENHVNLNRNFGRNQSLYSTANLEYDRISGFFEQSGPAHAPINDLAKTTLFAARQIAFNKMGGGKLNQTISQGQFRHPRGVEYGGEKAEPQTEFFMNRFEELASHYKNILVMDLHTGLGERFELHLIPSDHRCGVHPDLVAEHLSDVLTQTSPFDAGRWTPATTEGFYTTYGDLTTYVGQYAEENQGKKLLAITMEFGTLGSSAAHRLDTLSRLKLENQGFHNGYLGLEDETFIRERFRELFYPTEPRWRANAVNRTRRFWKKIFAHALTPTFG